MASTTTKTEDDGLVAAGAAQDLLDQCDKLGAAVGQLARQLAAQAARGSAAPPTGSPPAMTAAVPAQPPADLKPLEERLSALAQRIEAQGKALAHLQDLIERGFEQLAEYLSSHPAAPAIPEAVHVDLGAREPSPQPIAYAADQWETAILGRDLANVPALAFQRQELIQGVLEGDAGARSLAGQLLIFQSSPAERLPQLLKEIGEAFYRWQPKTRPGNTPVEEALARWLKKSCEASGIYNTIELVHPGERFDATRHNASSRGVEITEVFGWVVLRDNGKVYTKATVDVR